MTVEAVELASELVNFTGTHVFDYEKIQAVLLLLGLGAVQCLRQTWASSALIRNAILRGARESSDLQDL